MKHFTKKIIPYFLVLIIITSSICSCYSVSVYASAAYTGMTAKDWYELLKESWVGFAKSANPSEQERIKFFSDFYRANGFVSTASNLGLDVAIAGPMLNKMARAIDEDQANKTLQENIQAIRNAVENGIHFDDNNKTITIDNSVRNMFVNGSDYLMTQYGYYYAYSWNLSECVSAFTDGIKYAGIANIIRTYGDDYYIGYKYNTGHVLLYKKNNNLAFVSKSYNSTLHLTECDLYDYISWNKNNEPYKIFHYEDGEYVEIDNASFAASYKFLAVNHDPETGYKLNSVWGHNRPYLVTMSGFEICKVYRTLNDLKSESTGHSGYYITNNYNNFKNSTNNYTIDNSNHNPVTYNDITNYIDNYYRDRNTYPDPETVQRWIEDPTKHEPEPTPTPTPTPTPVFTDPTNPYPTGVPYPTTNPRPTESPDDFDPWEYPTVSGNGDDSSGWSFWDFLKAIVNALANIVNGIKDIFNKIADWFSVDTIEIKDHVSGVLDGSVPLPNGVSYNGIANEIIPVEDIKSIGKAFTDIPDGFVPGTYYPKLTIQTPQIIRQFYDEDEIVLLDFEEWASTFVIVRTLLEFSFWLAEIYYLLSKLRPVITIG